MAQKPSKNLNENQTASDLVGDDDASSSLKVDESKTDSQETGESPESKDNNSKPDPRKRAGVTAEPSFAEKNRVTIYTPDSTLSNPKALISSIFDDTWRSRGLSVRLFTRNLTALYKQTILGLFWIFLPPLANTAMWIFINSISGASLEKGLGGTYAGVPYPAFVLTGMVFWQAFIEAFQKPMNVVQSNRNMFSKVKFPIESLMFVGVLEVIFNSLIRMLMLIPVLIACNLLLGGEIAFQLTLPLALVGLLGTVLLAAALGLLIMPFGALFHDIGKGVLVFVPFWMILTPVVYAPFGMTPETQGYYFFNLINPAAPFLLFSRDMILNGSFQFGWPAGIALLITIPLFLIGLLIYRVSIPILVERIS